MKEYYTTKEIAAGLGVSRQCINSYIKRDYLKAKKMSHVLLIAGYDLREFLCKKVNDHGRQNYKNFLKNINQAIDN